VALPLFALINGILLSSCLDPLSVWVCLPIAILVSFRKRWFGLIAIALLGAGVASLQSGPPAYIDDTTATRLTGRLTKAPEWRGVGTYLDLELQVIDAQSFHGKARLSEFLDDPEQRALFDALGLGSGDRLEIVVKLHRPGVY
jgi:hypothetical protein